ncbi:MAG: 5-oxoprolinase subunit PxpB [Chloroflexi bacterium]|nr:5-oxoprolinase subunit PxpB [Chloroflexota bacterium]
MIQPFGEHALLVELEGPDAARSLAASLERDPVDGVEAAIPGLGSVLVELTPPAGDRAGELGAQLADRVASLTLHEGGGRVRTIPVVYGGAHGPDLDRTAAVLGISADELVARHAATELQVLFCGFAPGFAYLGELPQGLRVPRLDTPRTRTPSGSVAVAGPMSGIYPAELPGGWPVIGRTPLLLFDARRDPPAYLAPGDTVRWEPIDHDGWSDRPRTADDW